MYEDEVVLLSAELKDVHVLREARLLLLSTDSDSEEIAKKKMNDCFGCSYRAAGLKESLGRVSRGRRKEVV